MQVKMPDIPLREALHVLGWRGTPVEPALRAQIETWIARCMADVQPHAVLRRFATGADGTLEGASFCPEGRDARALLAPCCEAVLFAATLGAQSERMLLREQARDPAQALLLDAVLSAAIEAVCDTQEEALRRTLGAQGLHLTDRFSPGYGDMPMAQSRAICASLDADRAIGLTVSGSGVLTPRKSVTAIMGVSRSPVDRRPSGCAACGMRGTCALRRDGFSGDGAAV